MSRLLVTTAVAVAVTLGFVPQAMATHVSCGDVITQNTVLDSDLVDCPGNGLEIGAAGVTLDLAGHTVDGSGSGSGIAVMHTTTVREGTVQEFGVGINCLFAGFPGPQAFTEVEVRGSDTGVLADSCAMRFEQSSIHDNLQDGISVGFSILDMTDSAVYGNGGFGAVFSSANSVIERTAVYDNARTGVLFVVGNVAARSNTFVGNGENGLDVEFGTTSTVEGNIAAHNAMNGIRLDEDGTHTARDNTSTRNGADGILAEPGARFELTGNTTSSNGDDGIDVDDPNGTLTRNQAHRNADLGIEAVPGVTDGGGNRAKKNGNRLQCLNVTCRR